MLRTISFTVAALLFLTAIGCGNKNPPPVAQPSGDCNTGRDARRPPKIRRPVALSAKRTGPCCSRILQLLRSAT